MGRPVWCKHHDQGGLSVCSSTCLPVDAQGVLGRMVGKAGSQRRVSVKGPSLPISGELHWICPSSLPFPYVVSLPYMLAHAYTHTGDRIDPWLIHTQAQRVPQLHSWDSLNPSWLSWLRTWPSGFRLQAAEFEEPWARHTGQSERVKWPENPGPSLLFFVSGSVFAVYCIK